MYCVQCVRDVGQVNIVFDDGDVQVRYNNNSVFTFNPLTLVKVYFSYILVILCTCRYKCVACMATNVMGCVVRKEIS